MPRAPGNPDDKYRGNIFNVIPLVDSRHDFESTSQDTSIQIGADVAAQFDCFQNFTNNIQRIVIIGDANDDDRGYSQRLTSSCKGTNVMRGHPEDEFLKFVENRCGIPETPRDFSVATLGAWNAGGGGRHIISRGWNGENPPPPAPAAAPVAGGLGRGFRKILISGRELGHGYPTEREIEIALAMREGREPSRKPGRQIVVNPANVDRILAQSDHYDRYHQAIANAIRGPPREGEEPQPIPVVVDTTRTLQNKSDPHFIICRNRESVADPSITSKIQFPIVAREVIPDENLERNGPDYTINGVQHAIKGPLMGPTIRYTIGGTNYEYNFGDAGSKPNEIEVCKGKIKKQVDTIKTAAAGNIPGYYQNPIAAPPGVQGTRVAQLISLFDDRCTVYNRVTYTDRINDNVKKEIALPYIAKRGGDQLQALSCKQNIRYNITNGPLAAGNYDITNCVFWTIDRVAAIFAVLKGITTVLQLPTKDIIIYKNEGYVSRITAAAAGGAHSRKKIKRKYGRVRTQPTLHSPAVMARDFLAREARALPRDVRRSPRLLRMLGQLGKVPRGITPREIGPIPMGFRPKPSKSCTRERMKSIISNDENISSSCFLRLIEELCDPTSNYYDPFTLLNVINYYINISIVDGYRNNPINNAIFTGELELSLDNCIGIWPDDINVGGQPVIQPFYGGNDAAGRKYLVHFIAGAQDISIVWIGGRNNTIGINGEVRDLIGINGILPKIGFIDNTKMEFFKYAVSVEDAIQMENQGGGAESFYDVWSSLQNDFNSDKADKLFLQFIELLKLCENQYFLHRDTADNFYVYNPNTYIRVGGHTQIEMLSFINVLINEYKNTKSNSDRHKTFLLAFVYFPFLLQKIGFNIILTDITEYIGGWFDYENVSIYMPENIADLYSYFITTIIGKTLTKIKSVQDTLSPDTSKCANQLFSIFPHSYFNIQYNMLTMGTPGISTNETLNQIINTTATNSLQSTLGQGNNIQNIINKLDRLTVTNNSQSRVTSSVRKRNINKSKKRLTFINNSNLKPSNALPSKRKQPVGGKHLTKKRRKNKRKTHKKRKY